MKKLILIAVLLTLTVLQQGCGVVKGVGKAIGHTCQGIGAIGEGINEDLTAASDGHSNQYYQNRHK